jgi:CDGSH-type Zn-finger protein
MARPPGKKQKGPFVDPCNAGNYQWCVCENSASYPYCDGTHRDTERNPVGKTPIKVVLDRPCTVVWCACGASGNKPFCDGSHSRL